MNFDTQKNNIRIEEKIKKGSLSIFTFYIGIFLSSLLILIKMPLSFLPEWDVPQLLITIDSKTMQRSEQEKIIIKPLYQALSCANGIQEIRTLAKEGFCQFWIQLDWNVPFAKAENEIQAILDQFITTLPEKFFFAILQKVSNQRIPLCLVALENKNPNQKSFLETAQLTKDLIIPQLNLVKGTGTIHILGNKNPTIELEAKENNRFSSISIEEAYFALLESSYQLPTGKIQQRAEEIPIQYISPYQSLELLEEFPLGSQKIPLKNLFNLSFSEGELNQFFLLDGIEQTVLFIFGNGDNPIAAIKGIKKSLKALNDRIAPQYQLKLIENNGDLLIRKLNELILAFIIGIVSTFIVLFFFTRSQLAAFISTAMIPIAFSITIFLLGSIGKSINLMSLSGLAVSCGMIIDNNIIVMEMILKGKKETPWFKNAFFAIVGSTVSTLIIFLPLFLLKDLLGMLFKDLALTVTLTLLSSLFTSLTLLPALLSHHKIYSILEKKYQKELSFQKSYMKQIQFLSLHKKVLIISLILFFLLPSLFFPYLKTTLFENPSIDSLTVEMDFPSSYIPSRILENCQKIAFELKEIGISTYCQWGLSFQSQFNPSLGANGIEFTIKGKKKKDKKAIETYFQNSPYKEYFRSCYLTPTMIETALGNFEYRKEKIVPLDQAAISKKKAIEKSEEKIQIVLRENYLIQQAILPTHILPHLRILLNGQNGDSLSIGNQKYPFQIKKKDYKDLAEVGAEKIKIDGKEYRIDHLIDFVKCKQEISRFSINNEAFLIETDRNNPHAVLLYPSQLGKQIPVIITTSLLAFLSLFIFLTILFNSLKKAFITTMMVLIVLPFTLAIMALLKATINLESILSLLILSGSGINSIILLLESKKDCITTAANRLPSILMTTITTIIALIPFFGKNSIALPLCVGLIATNLIALFVLPCLLKRNSL